MAVAARCGSGGAVPGCLLELEEVWTVELRHRVLRSDQRTVRGRHHHQRLRHSGHYVWRMRGE
jgi:hypothetical protein